MDRTIIIQEGILLVFIVLSLIQESQIKQGSKEEYKNNKRLQFMVSLGGIFAMLLTFIAYHYKGPVISWMITLLCVFSLMMISGFTAMITGIISKSKKN